MKIRKEQFAALDKAAQADFHQRLLAFLRVELPEETSAFDDVALLQRIADADRRAAVHDIRSEGAVAQFVCLTFAAGPTFDEIPEVRAYLQEPGMEPEEKLDALVDYLDTLEHEEGIA